MYLDKIHSLQTGVCLEISTLALRDLIKDVTVGKRIPELTKIRCPADFYHYLSVIVHKDAKGLIKRRQAWVNGIKGDLLTGQPIPYRSFDSLFWRNLDEEDPDGDEWYRLTADEQFYIQLTNLLDMLRFMERNLFQSECAA